MSGELVAVDTEALRGAGTSLWGARQQLSGAEIALGTVADAGRDEVLGEARRYASGADADAAIRRFADRWTQEVDLITASIQNVMTLVVEAAMYFEQVDNQAFGR